MSGDVNNLWNQFLEGLATVGIQISSANFKFSNGLKIADWQLVDYTGISSENKGQIDIQNLYRTADVMPKLNEFTYIPTTSFYDQYAAYVRAIKADTTDSTLTNAKTRLMGYVMGEEPNTYPGYTISPDLNDFFQSSLQNSGNPPKLDFSITFPVTNANSTSKQVTRNNSLPSFIQLKRANESVKSVVIKTNTFSNERTSGAPDIELHFTAENIQSFTVYPNRWFNSAMITNYYDRIDPSAALANKTLFGANGVLSNRVVAVLVVFKRKLVVKATAEQLESLHAPDYLKTNENTVDIGGYTFKGGDATNFESDVNTYTYSDNSNAPYIIGYQITNLDPNSDSSI